MPTMSENPQATMTIRQGEAQYGTPEPQIEIRFPKGAHHRQVSAAIHKLAAEVELATPEHERWVVETEALYEGRGRVYLELADGTPHEAERGMAMLKKLVVQSRQPGDATGSLSHG
jgi:hypothetical protein